MDVPRRNWLAGAAVAAPLYLLTGPAMAAGLDGSSNMICAVTGVVACAEHANCIEAEARDFDLPDFMVMDVAEMVVRGTHISGNNEVSPIKNMELSGEHLIIQGVEESQGWSIAIDSEKGDMSAAVTGDMVSFILTGACAPI